MQKMFWYASASKVLFEAYNIEQIESEKYYSTESVFALQS